MQTFEEAFAFFLTCVAQKDESAFLQMMEPYAFWEALLPDGKPRKTLSDFLASQTEWFQSKTGSFQYNMTHTLESGELGIGIAQVLYQNQDAQGQNFSRSLQIIFCFQKLENRWVLKYLQNSLLAL